MDLKKVYGTDPSLELEGVDVHLGEDAYITLARAGGGNTRFLAAGRRLMAPYKRAIANDTIDEATSRTVMQAAYAEAVILGWRGIELDGEPLSFSVDNAKRLLAECPEVWRIVQEEATRFQNFRAEEIRAAGKASPTH